MVQPHIGAYRIAFSVLAILTATGAQASDEQWRQAQIADALTAAPPAVTKNAGIYAWDADGRMLLVRHGSGPYTCVASGMTSTRVGKPPLPFPDPMCLDQNAWRFFQALWAEKNPLKPQHPYPTAPGIVWMLAGMGLAEGMVKIGSSREAEVAVAKSGKKITRLSPHIMIMPLPIDEKTSGMESTYDPEHPYASWVMMRGTAIEHLMIHLPEAAVKSMMVPNP